MGRPSQSGPRLADLTSGRPFVERHVGPDEPQVAEMLKASTLSSLEALMDDAVPGRIRSESLDLPPAATERATAVELRELAARNNPLVPMIGLGYHGTVTPPVIRRNVLEDPSWYTAYTPYQPEISQGRLEALLNFQTMVADLTGVTTANASLLDEGTAAAEAMTLVRAPTARPPARSSSTPMRCRRRSRWCAPAPRRWASRWSSPTSATGCRTATSPACSCSTPAPPAGSSTRAR